MRNYTTMIDLSNTPQEKQLISVISQRKALLLETHVLEHTLQVCPNTMKTVEEVLDILQQNFKGSSNEALCCQAYEMASSPASALQAPPITVRSVL